MELEDTVVISTQISRVVELETQKHYVMAGSEAEGAISRVYSKARFITSILIIYDLSLNTKIRNFIVQIHIKY